ncbi:uncharacterized protein LOC130753186 isoform X3 [Actinidia eriantha]|uniref:uncharacterized protein LOC130753186 isoform X3 n=1 Tax=Actinidia eriantha TaxID=165200 RepID=UPI002590EE16|nr:uncharacterized protein LOC130753186 isoform X3 [Actinidia eriantha]
MSSPVFQVHVWLAAIRSVQVLSEGTFVFLYTRSGLIGIIRHLQHMQVVTSFWQLLLHHSMHTIPLFCIPEVHLMLE